MSIERLKAAYDTAVERAQAEQRKAFAAGLRDLELATHRPCVEANAEAMLAASALYLAKKTVKAAA